VPVQLDVAITDRLPEPIQTAAYYLVAEALTNTAKHAHAATVHVQVDTDHTDAGDPVLRVAVRDDGRGGADPHSGSGLVGLTDRVDALGGRLWLHSPPGAGTTVRAELPLSQAHAQRYLGSSDATAARDRNCEGTDSITVKPCVSSRTRCSTAR
jgi:signal transduction histidine kinase